MHSIAAFEVWYRPSGLLLNLNSCDRMHHKEYYRRISWICILMKRSYRMYPTLCILLQILRFDNDPLSELFLQMANCELFTDVSCHDNFNFWDKNRSNKCAKKVFLYLPHKILLNCKTKRLKMAKSGHSVNISIQQVTFVHALRQLDAFFCAAIA